MNTTEVRIAGERMTGQRLKRDYDINYGVLDMLIEFGIIEKSDPDKIVPYCTFTLQEVRAGIVVLGKLFEDQKDFIPEDFKTLMRTQAGWEKFLTRVMFQVRFLKPEAAAKIMFKAMEKVMPFLIETDSEILLPGIGKIVAETHEARTIHVPSTKEKRNIAARRVWKLRMKKSLKQPTTKEASNG